MRAVIISGGAVSDYEFIKKQIYDGDTIICADSGYNHAAKMGIAPAAVVGDFDSIGNIPTDVHCISYPSKKDKTDTEIAVDFAREKGFKDFLLIAATGSRIDHSLSNILLLKSFLENGENAVILNENNKVMITKSRLVINEPRGSIVSLVPLADCRGVTTENLEYPLFDADMFMGKGLGVSNIMSKNSAVVTLKEGLMLVIVARD